MLVQAFGSVMYWVSIALLVFTVVAFIDAAVHREDAYRAADKQTKPFWLIILGISAALNFFMGGVMAFLPILGLIATIVYTVDVRPALKRVSGRRGGPRRGGSSSDGPYGPYNGGR
ncbi:DUF2516 family protein [Streptomyces sp. NPDC050617]|uniref:DUF2516 family protein n=1 Tax=Streptomyces sp. NPDC050617 TaxID=3154628 RepID=UPI00341F9217